MLPTLVSPSQLLCPFSTAPVLICSDLSWSLDAEVLASVLMLHSVEAGRKRLLDGVDAVPPPLSAGAAAASGTSAGPWQIPIFPCSSYTSAGLQPLLAWMRGQ